MNGKSRDIIGTERVVDAGGRQYHIDCAPGDLAPFILVGGSPERVEAAEVLLESVRLRRRHREFATITGEYRGVPVSVMSSGIGCDNTEILVIEASQCVDRPTFIRVGSCGALRPEIAIGDLVISDKVIRRENTSLNYVTEDHLPRSDPEVLAVLRQAAEEMGYSYHVGTTCTTSSFYAGQGRQIEGFPALNTGILEELRVEGVLNFEMEMSILFTLAEISTLRLRAGGICTVFANRALNQFIPVEKMGEAQEHCLLTGLRAVRILSGK